MAKAKSEIESFASDVATQLVINRRNILEAAEDLIRGALEEGRELDYAELDFLTVEAGYDRTKIADEVRRIGRVINLQAIAGDGKTRAQLDQLVIESKADLAKQVPKLREQAAAIESQIAALEKAESTASRRQNEVNAALEALTKQVPPSVAAANAAKRSRIKSTLGKSISELQIDLQAIKVVLAGPDANPHYWHGLKRFDRECVIEGVDGHAVQYGYSEKWPSVKKELAKSVPSREAEIADLEKMMAAELKAVEAELQVYWR